MRRGSSLACRAVPSAVRGSKQLARVVLPGEVLQDHGVYSLSAEETKHVTKVLRCNTGDAIELVTGSGQLQRCELAAVQKATGRQPASASVCSFSCLTTLTSPFPRVVACEPVQSLKWKGPKLELVVACGSLKGGRSDWLVEKATEMHAYAFTPLLTTNSSNIGSARNSNRKAGEDESQDGGRLQRWQRVTTAAMKQCLRVHAMKLPTHEHVWTVDEAAEALSNGAVALVASQGGDDVLYALSTIQQGEQGRAVFCGKVKLLLLVGPEGDWTAEELKKLTDAGAIAVGLGPHRLRVETAAVAMLSASMLFFDTCRWQFEESDD